MSKQSSVINKLEYQVLTGIVRSYGAAIFDLNSLLRLEFEAAFAKSELKLALLGLCRKSKVISMRKVAGERVYCVPYDVYFNHMTEISMALPHYLSPLDNVEEFGDSTGQDLVMDLLIMMGWISKEQPQLSKKGQLDKKLIEVMLQHIRLAPDLLAEHVVGKDAAKLTFPLPISILIDLGLRLSTIQITDGHLQLDEHRVAQWLELNPTDVKLQLYHLWFRVHYPEQPFIRHLLVLLPMLPSHQWFSIDHLFRWIEDHALGGDGSNEKNQQLMEVYLLAVQSLGWVEQGRTMEGNKAVKSLIGVDKTVQYDNLQVRWFVQPDFEILVPLGVSYSDHYKFNTYATLISRNLMYRYHITKDSIFAAFQQGWTTDSLLKHLESLARYEVPESIQISIMEWDKQYRGVRLETVVILRCETTAIAEELMTISEIAKILNEQSRLSPKIFLIPEEDIDFIHEMMHTYGYRTDKKGAESRTNKRAAHELEPSSGIFHSRIRYDMYTQDEQFPEIESLYPGLADVPSGWMNTYLAYHMSTRKQLLQQAIDWQCYVQAAYEGEDIIIAPVSITLEGSTPQVAGIYRGKNIQTALDKLEAMRLIVPGIHDVTKYISTID
ncbi:MAG: helicase-associated domain-containing protein [Paenibacillaceae bacterium]